jgi:hypothetical protein
MVGNFSVLKWLEVTENNGDWMGSGSGIVERSRMTLDKKG